MSYPVFYVEAGDTLPILFDTFDGGTGASITMTGLAVTDIEVYKDGGATQRASDAGYTLLDTDGIDFDSLTGIHGFSLDLSDNTDAGFYAVGSWYHVVVSSITVDAQTVSFIAAAFRIVSATRGLAGTALPDAAADAAGGLPISDAGGLDLDTQIGTDIDAILTDTAVIGAPAGASVSADIAAIKAETAAIVEDTGTTLPATLATIDGIVDDILVDTAVIGAPAGASVSADIAAVKSDTAAILTDTAEIGAAGAGLSAVPWNAAWDAEVQSECADALTAYAPATAAKLLAYTQLLARSDAAIETDNATELTEINADGGSGAGDYSAQTDSQEALAAASPPTTGQIADAVWDELVADHAGVGSTGAALAAAGGSGDPWSTAIPGAYGAGTAGYILGTNLDAAITARTVAAASYFDPATDTVDVGKISGDAAAADNLEAALDGTGGVTITAAVAGNITGNLSGSVGSVTGAVGSVTGAVGSVTGAVGSVTGNVGGNVVGSVASVVGNVGGNVAGSVASVTNQVTADVTAISGDATAANNLESQYDGTGLTGDTYPATQAAVAGLSIPTAAAIADAVCDEALAGHVTAGTVGKAIADIEADTNELQTNQGNWATATTVDLNADQSGVTIGTVTTLTGHTAQTGDNYARLGAPAGASVSADVAAVKAVVDALPDAAAINAQVVDVLRTDTIPDSYSAHEAQPTIAQAVLEIRQALTEASTSGTTITIKKPDGASTAFTLTTDDETTPTSVTRAT